MSKRGSGVRHELTRTELARRGFALILGAALVLVLLALYQRGAIGGPDRIEAHLSNAGGSLATGADVKMRGVIVGRVATVEADPHGGVRVIIDMDSGMLGKIPSNIVASVLPATTFGTSFVNLKIEGPWGARPLAAGAVVPADTRQSTLEVQRALDDVDQLVKAVNPAKLNATLGAAASALDGRGAELGAAIAGLTALSQRLQSSLPLLSNDLHLLAGNLHTLSAASPSILDGLASSLDVLHAVATSRSAVGVMLRGGAQVADRLRGLLTVIAPNLTSFLSDAAVVVTTYATWRRQAFADSFATLRRLAVRLRSLNRRGMVPGDLVIQTQTPGYYGRADCPRFGSAAGDNC